MALYLYSAINETGNPVSGEVEADSRQHAMELVALKGFIPEKIQKKAMPKTARSSSRILSNLLSPISHKEMILYTMQLRTLLDAGVPIIQIFRILEEQTNNSRLRDITRDMEGEVRSGGSLFQAFSRHRHVFSKLYCTMIKAGELSGTLPDILKRLIYILEHEEKIRGDIKAAIRYPAIVLCFLVLAFFVLLTFVIPKFVVLFQGAGIALPFPTRVCMFMYEVLSQYWFQLLIAGTVLLVSCGLYLKTKSGRFFLDYFLLRVPLVGSLMVKTAMSRFASIFSILQSSGTSVLESIKLLSETLNNEAINREFGKIEELLVEGRGIAVPLSRARYFPSMVVNMVAIGEESGNLDGMLTEIARHYDIEVEYATKTFSDALGPLLVVGLSAIVGFFAFAIFLPMWDLTKMVQ